jgi:pilus assembly protein Flp/PilA
MHELEQLMLNFLRGILKSQAGATAVEYGLIVSLVVVAIMAAISNVANSTNNMWNRVSNEIVTATE